MRANKRIIIIFLLLALAGISLTMVSAGIGDWFRKMTGRDIESQVTLNITVTSSTPRIVWVGTLGTISPAEGNYKIIYINFTANDSDGAANLKDNSAYALLTHSAGTEAPRYNFSCAKDGASYGATNQNYTCLISMWYFDRNGDWTINLSINDSGNAIGRNDSINFTFGELSAFVSSPSALTFQQLSPGATNQSATNDPMLLNNTGNKNIVQGNVQINATNLLGETDSDLGIWVSNFSIASVNGSNAECDTSAGINNATIPVHTEFTPLNLTTLPRGNNSLAYSNSTSGQEQIYFCIRKIGFELSAQSYSTLANGAWTIKII